MYVVRMMLCTILNNIIHRGRTKIEITKGRKTKVQVLKCIPCYVCFTFEIDAAGKYLSPKSLLQPGYLCKYSNRSRTVMYTTV